jgi:type IV secretion system protein VirD4
MLSKSDFDMESIGIKPTAVFLIIPDEKSTFHKLASIFIKQCYESLIDVAQKQENLVLPNRVNFVLDEFSNLPTINDFPNMITAARSRNIRFLIVTQSSNQLVSKYKSQAETIKSNCDNWIFLTSKELSLLKELSELCGLRKISPQTNLMSVARLQHLRKERKTSEALVLCQRNYPFIDKRYISKQSANLIHTQIKYKTSTGFYVSRQAISLIFKPLIRIRNA